MPVKVPDDNFYRIVEPRKPTRVDVAKVVGEALDNPLEGVSLNSAVKSGCTAGIIVDSILPAAVRRETMNHVTTRLGSLGVKRVKVFQRKRLSSPTFSAEDGRPLDPISGSFTEIGKTSTGTSVDLDNEVLSCDVKIIVSLAMPHFASGLTGGPEAAIPSASSLRSIGKNRSLMMKGLHSPFTLSDNQVLSDSLEACKLAGPFYSICFLPDGWGSIQSAQAGEIEPVFRDAVKRYAELHSPKLERKLDIVIVSAGRLLGTDLYHAIRVASNVLGAVKKDGTIILVAECSRGVGDNIFLDYARKFRERKDLFNELRYRFKLGAHANIFLQEVLEKCRIQLVSVLPELFVRDTFDLKPSQTATEAVQKAIRVEGKESKLLIVPKGEFTVPMMDSA